MVHVRAFRIDTHLRRVLPTLLVVYLPTLAALVVLVGVHFATGIRISEFTRDPVQVLKGPAYVGVYSNLGILGWSWATTVCFFSRACLKRQEFPRSQTSFLAWSGGISAMLLFDDLFLLHDVVFPQYLRIPELIVPPVYALIVMIYLMRFRTTIADSDYPILGLAFAFFGASVAVDVVGLVVGEFKGIHLFEDGAKLIGIVSWATYFTRTCLQMTSSAENGTARSATSENLS